MKRIGFVLALIAVAAVSVPVLAQTTPEIVNYQGRVMDNGSPYNGQGFFKFAICDGAASNTYWSNDSTSAACGEPTNAVSLSVSGGLYSVGLGDATLPNMNVLPASVFSGSNDVYLQVWFGDTTASLEALAPMQRITSVGYAMQAENAQTLQGLQPNQIGGEPDVVIVDAAGRGDAATITAGLALAGAMPPPVLVKVIEGTYVETALVIPDNVAVRCMQPQSCVVDAVGGPAFIAGNNTRVEGFVIRNALEGVVLPPGNGGVWIRDNLFQDDGIGVSLLAGVTACSDVIIEDNYFDTFSGDVFPFSEGVRMTAVNNLSIIDNEFFFIQGPAPYGINISNGVGAFILNNDFSEILSPSGSAAAINVDMIENVVIEDNIVAQCSAMDLQGIDFMGVKTAAVRDNVFLKISGDSVMAIRAADSDFVSIENNQIIEVNAMYGFGVLLEEVRRVRVVDNNITYVALAGEYSFNDWAIRYVAMSPMPIEFLIIKDNVITFCNNGIHLDYSMPGQEGAGMTDEQLIESNVVIKGPGEYGRGILVDFAHTSQILKNKVRKFEVGIEVVGGNPMYPLDVNIMRNESTGNGMADLLISSTSGTFRSYWNYLNVFPKGGIILPAVLIQRQDYDNAGNLNP